MESPTEAPYYIAWFSSNVVGRRPECLYQLTEADCRAALCLLSDMKDECDVERSTSDSKTLTICSLNVKSNTLNCVATRTMRDDHARDYFRGELDWASKRVRVVVVPQPIPRSYFYAIVPPETGMYKERPRRTGPGAFQHAHSDFIENVREATPAEKREFLADFLETLDTPRRWGKTHDFAMSVALLRLSDPDQTIEVTGRPLAVRVMEDVINAWCGIFKEGLHVDAPAKMREKIETLQRKAAGIVEGEPNAEEDTLEERKPGGYGDEEEEDLPELEPVPESEWYEVD